MLRNPATVFYLIFVYGVGLLVRIPTSDVSLIGIVLSSLFIDTLLVGTILLFAHLVLGRVPEKLPLTVLVPISVALAFFSGGVAFFLVQELRVFTLLGPDGYFTPIVIFTYFSMLAALYNLQFMWVRHAQLASDRALAVAHAERRAALSELRRLRTQIQPHFLFNVLNNIHIEIGNSPAQAAKMVAMLSDHLRNALDLEDTLFVSLEADIHLIRSFIALQQMRFGTDIKLRLDVSPAAARQMVPAFLLLPLVENATKFGDRAAGGVIDIQIDATCEDDVLQIAVANTGSLAARRKDLPGTQTGLSNLKARLALHYPARHRFDLLQENDKVVVRIELTGEPC